MTPGQMALRYAEKGWPVFPCHSTGTTRKRPLTPHGFRDATTDRARIHAWWHNWPDELIGAPTGAVIGAVVLDIDVKDPATNGFDTLDDLGAGVLPTTPMVHTPSGGLHLYFANPERPLRCSAGLIGPGLDVRAIGGYIIVPSPGSGYVWDPIHNFKNTPPASAPSWLWPPPSAFEYSAEPILPVLGLSPYGEAAIESACNAIAQAGPGQQERTLNTQCFSIGTLAGADAIPMDIALRTLLRAAATMPDFEPAWPWRPEEIEAKVRRAFAAGLAKPRERARAVA